ncbi:uncharacterized protein LOC116850773 [Odontomachus brunneus]|uniref:uncharacterized protein LOC116850773 n=1 Tax=Odontomachus brunneus TaxID=486640 RepID=UPI0013F2A056|nr:uncharacterized protein LOC116850773 [Odontomachus brunneus]
MLINNVDYEKIKGCASGGSSQCSYVQSEKRRERSQGGLRSRIYSKIPLIAPHKNLPENMSRVPLMASNSSAPEVADRRNTVLLEVMYLFPSTHKLYSSLDLSLI